MNDNSSIFTLTYLLINTTVTRTNNMKYSCFFTPSSSVTATFINITSSFIFVFNLVSGQNLPVGVHIYLPLH